jgi:hypothetical protein
MAISLSKAEAEYAACPFEKGILVFDVIGLKILKQLLQMIFCPSLV